VRVCPQCGHLADYDSYFGAYICPDCDWFDNTIGLERQRRYMERSRAIHRDRLEDEGELVVGAK